MNFTCANYPASESVSKPVMAQRASDSPNSTGTPERAREGERVRLQAVTENAVAGVMASSSDARVDSDASEAVGH
jgi:hypothetical protein